MVKHSFQRFEKVYNNIIKVLLKSLFTKCEYIITYTFTNKWISRNIGSKKIDELIHANKLINQRSLS